MSQFRLVGLSAMVRGAHNGNSFIVKEYSENEAEALLQEYFTPQK